MAKLNELPLLLEVPLSLALLPDLSLLIFDV